MPGVQLENRDRSAAVRDLLRSGGDARKLINTGKEESGEEKEGSPSVSSYKYALSELELFERKKRGRTGSQDPKEEGGQQLPGQ